MLTHEEQLDFCQRMIQSVLAYHYSANPEDTLHNRYLEKYIDALGIDTVRSMVVDTLSRIAYIAKDVYTDSEGCSYNSIVWKED